MQRFRLPKSTKLCSPTAVERLFDREAAQGVVAYPLRAVWRENTTRTTGEPLQFMITVPKKKLRHAVDRVTMRRRIREAYRLARHSYQDSLPEGKRIDMAIIFLGDKLIPYHIIERSVHKILSRVCGVTNVMAPTVTSPGSHE